MSDSLANERTLAPTSDNGQSAQVSAESQGSTSEPASKGQPAQDENIRKLQSTYDRKLAESNRQLQQQQQVVAQLHQRLQQMEDTAAPDDFSRMELRVKRAEEAAQYYANQYNQTVQQQQEQSARDDAFNKIAERYGVTKEEIAKANPSNYEDAVDAAIAARERSKQRKNEQDDDKRNRNLPDVGGGAPITSMSKWEEQYDAAMKRKDTPAIMRLNRLKPKG